MESIQDRAIKWLTGSGTGTSSKALCKTMLGQNVDDDYCHPHDGSDLGRCITLLDLIPEWRPRISEMSKVSDEWKALSQVWPELEALHRAGDYSATYKRMKQILNPIEDKRSNLVRIGEGASLYFGSRTKSK